MNPYNSDQALSTMNKYACCACEAYVQEPTTACYSSGVIPRDTLPAKWWNWFIQCLTQNEALSSCAFADVYTELKNVLSGGGQTASSSTHNQLYTAIKQIVCCNPTSRANNLIGGTKGSLPYQSAANTTTFLNLGSAETYLKAGFMQNNFKYNERTVLNNYFDLDEILEMKNTSGN